jgi:hypothetical protein
VFGSPAPLQSSGPRIVKRMGHHAGPNWIEFNVAIAGENASRLLR